MQFLSEIQLTQRKHKTNEGYLICLDAVLARIGIQEYLSDELFNDNDETIINVYRRSQDVFEKEAISSFENKAITIEHPNDFVNPSNYHQYSVGFVRDVKRKEIDGNEYLVGNLVITDQEAIDLIESEEKVYLSCGYDCEIIEEDGKYYQTKIRGNHLALTDMPRGGQNLRIRDSIRNIRRIDSKEFKNEQLSKQFQKRFKKK